MHESPEAIHINCINELYIKRQIYTQLTHSNFTLDPLHLQCANNKMKTAVIVAVLVLVVLDMTAANRPHHCKLPVDHGHQCSAHSAKERIYYDHVTKKCKPFNYRGCGGNKNRFKSHHDCRQECS